MFDKLSKMHAYTVIITTSHTRKNDIVKADLATLIPGQPGTALRPRPRRRHPALGLAGVADAVEEQPKPRQLQGRAIRIRQLAR